VRRALILAAIALAVGGAAIWQLHRVYTADGASILVDGERAAWIRAADTIHLGIRDLTPQRTAFFRRIWLSDAPATASIVSRLGIALMGLDRPAADVSRGSSAHDILGVAAIVGLQSIE